MRIILGLLILLSACKSGPEKNTVSFKDIEPLEGNWIGIQAVLLNDDQTISKYPSTVVVALLKDSLELSVTNTYPDGHQETEKGILSINGDSSKLSLGASEYDIRHVIRTDQGLTIITFKEDEDNDRPAEIRLKIIMGAGELNMLRDVKYKGSTEYLNRIHLSLTKK